MTAWLNRLSERQVVILLMAFGLLLYIPFAGSYGLWDPWETHYGEVARQMLKRGDVISLYWPGSPLDSEFFWSKPVLTFWIIGLSMWIGGLRGAAPGELATSHLTEWVLRIPFCLFALTALYGVYFVAARFVSRRAGILAAVILATMPMFSLIARQAMTDMPFIGPMTLALALCIVALFDEETADLPRRHWKRLSWPAHPTFYVAIGLFVAIALPQLIADSIQLVWRFHIGERRMALPGVLVMLPYIAGFVWFLLLAAKTRQRASLYFYIAGILAALAVLSKGLAGLGLPVIVLLAYLIFTWNWARLGRPQIIAGLIGGLIACAVVAVPWHHAMLVRHGIPFWSELYGDNHWRRMILGRHGDRGSFEYFVREAAYAVLPWLAFVPSALGWAVLRMRQRQGKDGRPSEPGAVATTARDAVLWFGAIWFAAAYALVSLSMTKFHHYILPALPGLAIVLACFLDDQLNQPRSVAMRLVPLVGIPLFALVTYDLLRTQNGVQRFIWLFCYDYVNTPTGRPWPPELNFIPAMTVFAMFFAIGASLVPWYRARRWAIGATCALSILFTFYLLDVYMKKVSDVWSQKGLIATYYKLRKSPEERLVAWQMYWRGETFYTQNEIYEGPQDKRTVFLGNRNTEDLQAYLGRNPGKRVFFVVERTRLDQLRSLLPEATRPSLKVINDTNNKFYLAAAQM